MGNENYGLANVEPPKRSRNLNTDKDATHDLDNFTQEGAKDTHNAQLAPASTSDDSNGEAPNAQSGGEGSDDDSIVDYTDPDGDNTTPDNQDPTPETSEAGADINANPPALCN